MQDVGGDPKEHLPLRRMETNCRGSKGQHSFGKAYMQKTLESLNHRGRVRSREGGVCSRH